MKPAIINATIPTINVGQSKFLVRGLRVPERNAVRPQINPIRSVFLLGIKITFIFPVVYEVLYQLSLNKLLRAHQRLY